MEDIPVLTTTSTLSNWGNVNQNIEMSSTQARMAKINKLTANAEENVLKGKSSFPVGGIANWFMEISVQNPSKPKK